MAANWFFKSRGPHAGEDYTWHSLGDADPENVDEILERGWRGRRCSQLVDDEQPGMLLVEDQRRGMTLIVTGIFPPGRPEDYRQRPIRVSLLGAASHDDDPAYRSLVAVAVRALRDGLAESLPIRYGTGAAGAGFAVDAEEWSELVAGAAEELEQVAGPSADPATLYLQPDTKPHRAEVAAELATLFLAAGEQAMSGRILVLRTNLLSRAEISALRPWQTLSDVTNMRLGAPAPPAGWGSLGELGAVVADKMSAVLRDRMGRFVIALVLIGAVVVVVTVVLHPGTSVPNQPAHETKTGKPAGSAQPMASVPTGSSPGAHPSVSPSRRRSAQP